MNKKIYIKNVCAFLIDNGFSYLSYKNDNNTVFYYHFSKPDISIIFYQDYRRECLALDIEKLSQKIFHMFGNYSESIEMFEGYNEMKEVLLKIYSEALSEGRLSLYDKYFKMVLDVYVKFLKQNLKKII